MNVKLPLLAMLFILLAACVPAKGNEKTLTPDFTPIALDETWVPELPTPELVPQPHPTPGWSEVESFALVVNAFKDYLAENKGRIHSNGDIQILWSDFTAMHLQVGTSKFQVSEVLINIKDWKTIEKVGNDLEDDKNWGSPALATILMLRGGCRTNCKTVFNALWWAAAHLASGANWFEIPESAISNHPEPVLCGRDYDWEYLVDMLDNNCDNVRVEYRGSVVRVTRLIRPKPGEYDYSYQFSPADTTFVTFLATSLVVGVTIVLVPEAAPVLIPVLLVP